MIQATPVTAALAGVFSALMWPSVWSRWGGGTQGGNVELIVATLLILALPAHVFVVGLKRSTTDSRGFDSALLKRIGAWLLAAGLVVAVRNFA